MPTNATCITTDQLIAAIEARNGYPLNDAQKKAVRHQQGPLWIIAGPGTGKTEVLVARCLRLMCCDGVDPKSILVTTFTEKAAMSLQQRISEGMADLCGRYPQLEAVDASGLRIGTLHALCNDILQEYRYESYRNLRLLDDIESKMLFRGQVASKVRDQCQALLEHFDFLYPKRPKLNLWDITKGTVPLLNRIVEDNLDSNVARQRNEAWRQAIQVSEWYDTAIAEKRACDVASVQRYFVNFLGEPVGRVFLEGDAAANKPPLLHVLVDEYQDTNPIQETIYFSLASRAPYNITVVGDDDQALYRFRGGSVESMVGFGQACRDRWGVSATSIQLRENYRSHQAIVDWCERFISGSPRMRTSNARAPGKLPLLTASGRSGRSYPAVGYLQGQRSNDVASAFADMVRGLLDHQIIDDPSQCVLLLTSTQEGPRGAGPYVSALRQRGIQYYNPRSKSFAEQPEVQALMGALLAVLDPGAAVGSTLMGLELSQMIVGCRDDYQSLAALHPELRQYVEQSNRAIRNKQRGEDVTSAVPTIIYRILSLPPFTNFQQDVEKDLRLSKVTRLLEAFCAQYGRKLRMDQNRSGQVNNWWLGQFYYVFCGYLSTFGIDDDEDDDVICPPGRMPIMTIHQAKGLEFDFVFVGTIGRSVSVDEAIQLEERCRPLRRTQPTVVHTAQDLAWHDDIRAHYVAYSRARHALILLATKQQLRKKEDETASFGAGGGTEFCRTTIKL